MILFDTLKEMITDINQCPVCDGKLKHEFAEGKYDDIINVGHSDRLVKSKLNKKTLILNRSVKVEDTEIKCKITYDLDSERFDVKLNMTPDQIINKFPIAQSLLDLEDFRLRYAIDNGLVNIFKVVNRLQADFYFIQTCKNHYKRISILGINSSEDKFEEFRCFDEFYYAPTKEPGYFYSLREHRSPATKREKFVFIQLVNEKNINDIDPKRGGVWLFEKNDYDLMQFDYKDTQKLSRRLHTIHALRG